jgi:signal transduction histidine kinase
VSLSLGGLKDHILQAIATAAVLGGGATLISTKVENAQQAEQLTTLTKTLPEIQKDVRATREAVIRLEARQEK